MTRYYYNRHQIFYRYDTSINLKPGEIRETISNGKWTDLLPHEHGEPGAAGYTVTKSQLYRDAVYILEPNGYFKDSIGGKVWQKVKEVTVAQPVTDTVYKGEYYYIKITHNYLVRGVVTEFLAGGWYAFEKTFAIDFDLNPLPNRTLYQFSYKGDIIDTVIAEEGAYPVNGLLGDYWYVRGARVFPDFKLKVDGQLKASDNGWVKVDGQLKAIDRIWVKANGQLKEV